MSDCPVAALRFTYGLWFPASATSVVWRWRCCLPRWALSCQFGRSICRRLKAASAIRVCRPSRSLRRP